VASAAFAHSLPFLFEALAAVRSDARSIGVLRGIESMVMAMTRGKRRSQGDAA